MQVSHDLPRTGSERLCSPLWELQQDGARVLDPFAGSGALGLEALSRGAQEAVFCEKNASCTEQLSKNIKTLKRKGIAPFTL